MVAWLRFLVVTPTLGFAAACARPPAVPSAPSPSTPTAALEQFLAAVNAGDLGRMAELWGTERGPSTVIIPDAERQRRLTIMQRLLQHDSFRIVPAAGVATGEARRQAREVEIVRGDRRATVPFTLVMTRAGGWLITEIGLDAAVPAAVPRTTP